MKRRRAKPKRSQKIAVQSRKSNTNKSVRSTRARKRAPSRPNSARRRFKRELFLKPLRKKANGDKHGTFDIETNQWTKFEMGGAYDGRSYRQHNTLPELVTDLCSERFRNRTIYAHNGGKFDFLFIAQELNARNKPYKMICQGARIVELKIMSGRNVTRLRDSISILGGASNPISLKKLCEVFAPETLKMSGVIDFENERVDKNNSLHCQYLKADCLSLFDVITKFKTMPFIRDVGMKLTIASTALAAWRSTLKKSIPTTVSRVQNFCREAYAGGRVEIFRAHQFGGAQYDVNSLFPTCMLKPLPLEYLCDTNDASDFGFHDVTVEVPETYIPILWTKTPKLIFPTGTFRGTYFSEELKLAIEQGARILKHHKGMVFTQTHDLFHEFVLKNYEIRKNNKGTALDFVAKSLMNNCYGKLAERETKKSFERVDPRDPSTWPDNFEIWRDQRTFNKWGFVTVEKTKRSAHMLVHIPAAITAYARIHMAKNVYLPFQDKIHYTDTDSGFLSAEMPTGNDPGQVKREYGVNRGFFLLPKAYYIETDDGRVIRKIKGFPKEYLSNISLEDFQAKNLSYKRKSFLTLRESLIRNNEFLSVGERIKALRASYDKRKMLPDGNTIPWHLNNGVIEK